MHIPWKIINKAKDSIKSYLLKLKPSSKSSLKNTNKKKFYISRKLFDENKSFSEKELLSSESYIVVLAEPGAGKSELLDSLAAQLQTTKVSANIFLSSDTQIERRALVIDAFDEVSKIGLSSITNLLVKIQESKVDKVIISSRSSEWNSACTHHFIETFGKEPTIVRFTALNETEQKLLFENHTPGENFTHFFDEIARFDLEPLLPNPQFLQLFADAYVESEKHFKDKPSIFEKAIERLAKEENPSIFQKETINLHEKIKIANETFAKLLLSGSEGITSTEVCSTRFYPHLASLVDAKVSPNSILDTRLFKPADRPSQHIHVHKIISEYCAAKYITTRINDATDTLNISQCLSIMAPNSTVRDELRGMLGWMAALGNESTQQETIKIDPYAILSNGDPSRLTPSSKKLLLHEIKETTKEDPYFRRSDKWRTFSAAGFFTHETVEEIKPLLAVSERNGHLRGLLLELLVGSSAIKLLIKELQQLVLSPEESLNTRMLAHDLLLEEQEYDHLPDAKTLISEKSGNSLKIVAKIIEGIGPINFENQFIFNFLNVCTSLYPDRKKAFYDRTIGERYFIERVISTLELPIIEWLLNKFTKSLSCRCGKNAYECDCRNGVSKIVGHLLDRYFVAAPSPYCPEKVWRWVKNLNFHKGIGANSSRSIQELQQNDSLRQGIIKIAFENESDSEKIIKIHTENFIGQNHAGLQLQYNDYRFIINLAFNTDNVALWTRFIQTHNYYHDKNKKGPNELRKHMRNQANQKPKFMQEWMKRNRANISQYRKHKKADSKYQRIYKKRDKKLADLQESNIKFFNENRELVESGNHWPSLVYFAELYLYEPDQIEKKTGDIELVKKALKNCLDFLEDEIPTLQALAKEKCNSRGLTIITILYAACLEIFKTSGTLENVQLKMLKALRTNTNMSYKAISEEDKTSLKTEVDRLLFNSTDQVKAYIQEYIEPQVSFENCNHPDIYLLNDEQLFKPYRLNLPIEWLKSFPEQTLNTLDELFELSAKFGNRNELENLIKLRCKEFITDPRIRPESYETIQKRIFWLIRAFYFLPEIPSTYWDWIEVDKNTIHKFEALSGRMNRGDNSSWPTLTAKKIQLILDSFIDKWPKVDLPNSYGTGSPPGENAYRFLSDLIWSIGNDNPDNSIPVLDYLIADNRFTDFHQSLKSIRATAIREKALRDFEAPTPQEVVNLLDKSEVITVEGLRALLIQELEAYQKDLYGSETTSSDIFYENDVRLGEVPATLRIADRLRLRLESKGITITPEHQMNHANRCDFTCTKMIKDQRRLLVTEVKGQWHKDLYTAASEQLHVRYSNHPDAEQQGIYLVLWFGDNEKVANKKNTKLKTADDLKQSIEREMPTELKGLIDVFVLDLSKTT